MKNGQVCLAGGRGRAMFRRMARLIRYGIVTGLATAAVFAAPASAQVPVPEPVKEAFITGGNAADEAEREAIDFTCWFVFGAEPGTCAS